jgi:hypothetical protein
MPGNTHELSAAVGAAADRVAIALGTTTIAATQASKQQARTKPDLNRCVVEIRRVYVCFLNIFESPLRGRL